MKMAKKLCKKHGFKGCPLCISDPFECCTAIFALLAYGGATIVLIVGILWLLSRNFLR